MMIDRLLRQMLLGQSVIVLQRCSRSDFPVDGKTNVAPRASWPQSAALSAGGKDHVGAASDRWRAGSLWSGDLARHRRQIIHGHSQHLAKIYHQFSLSVVHSHSGQLGGMTGLGRLPGAQSNDDAPRVTQASRKVHNGA